jgi:hypothetical protein
LWSKKISGLKSYSFNSDGILVVKQSLTKKIRLSALAYIVAVSCCPLALAQIPLNQIDKVDYNPAIQSFLENRYGNSIEIMTSSRGSILRSEARFIWIGVIKAENRNSKKPYVLPLILSASEFDGQYRVEAHAQQLQMPICLEANECWPEAEFNSKLDEPIRFTWWSKVQDQHTRTTHGFFWESGTWKLGMVRREDWNESDSTAGELLVIRSGRRIFTSPTPTGATGISAMNGSPLRGDFNGMHFTRHWPEDPLKTSPATNKVK